MLNEYMKFTKKRPLTGAVIGISIIYGANMIRKAFTAEAGGFWGIGASTSTTSSTSSSHSMMTRTPAGDMMKHPTALFGYKNIGHCNCAVPTCPSCANMGLAGGMSTTTSTSSSSVAVVVVDVDVEYKAYELVLACCCGMLKCVCVVPTENAEHERKRATPSKSHEE